LRPGWSRPKIESQPDLATPELRPPSPAAPRSLATDRPRYVLAAALFVATLFSTTTLGAGWYLSTRTDVTTDLLPILAGETIRSVWSAPQLLLTGFAFSLPVLFILLCHELGHYFACRHYRLRSTLPYFLPAPLGLGTLGAFIRIRAPIRTKSQLLDIGAAGPIAGFVALLPFLFYGIARSRPAQVLLLDSDLPANLILLLPGRCLALELVTRIFHGPLGPGVVLDLHPFALAAWVGLLVTALNLLPLGQLDGGHILYATSSGLHRRLAVVLLALLAVAGIFWQGWLLWCVIVLIMGLRHPAVVDERQKLDGSRVAVALACLVIFILAFMPVPVSIVPIAG